MRQGHRADRRSLGAGAVVARARMHNILHKMSRAQKRLCAQPDLAFQPFFLALKDFAFNCAVGTWTQES
jgi:hypothetical protein